MPLDGGGAMGGLRAPTGSLRLATSPVPVEVARMGSCDSMEPGAR